MTIDELLFFAKSTGGSTEKQKITCNGNDAIATYYVLKRTGKKNT